MVIKKGKSAKGKNDFKSRINKFEANNKQGIPHRLALTMACNQPGDTPTFNLPTLGAPVANPLASLQSGAIPGLTPFPHAGANPMAAQMRGKLMGGAAPPPGMLGMFNRFRK